VTQQPMTPHAPEPSADDGGAEVSTRWIGRVVVVMVSGEVDMLTAPGVADAISHAAAESPAAVIVDLTDVEFLASAGMSVLITAHDAITPQTQFGVVADGAATSRPMKLVGVDQIIPLHRTIEDALASAGLDPGAS
jgi:anti-sigma B factor antagonist